MRVLLWLASREAEDGAVTVDWVVLTATVALIGAGVVSVLLPGLDTAGENIYSGIIAATGD